jgi:hypothetical protein
METGTDMTQQILAIQKTMIDNSFKAQALIQEQSERLARAALAPAGGWPAEGDRLWQGWSEALQNGRSAFQALVDAQFDMLGRLLAPHGEE